MTSKPEDTDNSGDEQSRWDAAAMNQELMIAVVRQHELTEAAEHAHKASDAEYRLLFENMLDGFVYGRMLYDDQGRPEDFIYLDVNSSFERLTGLKDVVGKKCSEAAPGVWESNQGPLDILGAVARTGQPKKFEVEMPALGKWFSISAYSTMQDHFVAVFDNITERKDIEQQKADLIAMIVHDIRSPLTIISGYADVLISKADTLDAETNEVVAIIKANGNKVANMLKGMCLISKQATGNLKLEPVPTDIDALLRDACREIEMSAQAKKLDIITETEDGLPTAKVDPSLLQRAVFNMLQNAVNYSPAPGTITLKGALDGNGFIAVSVTDTGNGIHVSEQGRVFDKYYRAETAKGVKGSGLGLAIVKAVAEAHGGRVELESVEGKGSTFRMLIPA